VSKYPDRGRLPSGHETPKKGYSLKILAVEDDPVARKILVQALRRLGYDDVSEARDGAEALALLEKEPARVIVSDWIMPGMDGLALCRQIRARVKSEYVYFILLTSREADIENQREATEAGVDDFLVKPLDLQELWMRLRVAERILRYATQVQQLEAFLPICSYCKKVRDDQNYWQQIEGYINARTGSEFSHSVCPDCYKQVILPELEALKRESSKPKAERQ
jgi:sigma-B regulation protein RsbU (phosphoserine phosphatase)